MQKAQKIDTNEKVIGQDNELKFKEKAAEFEKVEVQKVDGPEWKNKAAILAFMEEPVTIRVSESTDVNAETAVEVGNDGRKVFIPRGVPFTLKRKFVEVLARCKQTRLSQKKVTNQVGDEEWVYPEHTALRYPFMLIEDKNPKGPAWLNKILREV